MSLPNVTTKLEPLLVCLSLYLYLCARANFPEKSTWSDCYNYTFQNSFCFKCAFVRLFLLSLCVGCAFLMWTRSKFQLYLFRKQSKFYFEIIIPLQLGEKTGVPSSNVPVSVASQQSVPLLFAIESVCTQTHTHVHTFCVDPKWCWINSTRGSLFIGGAHTHTHKHTGQMNSWVGIVFQTSNFWLIYLCVCVCLCRVDSVHYLHGSSPTRTSVDSWL